jgi:archaellum component FlaF (FlaF/FlaG flagellin family)
MGLSVAVSGGIICATVVAAFSIVFAITGQVYEINSSRTQSSNLDSIVTQTSVNASYAYVQSGNNVVSITLENNGNAKLWDYENFNVIVTYNASISGSPSLRTEHLTYNSTQAFAQAGSNIGTQFARPDEDVSKGGWTDTTGGNGNTILYDEINESVQNNGNYARSATLSLFGASDTWGVGLQGVADPESSSNHIVRVAHRKTGLGGVTLTTTLLQGSTTIASWSDAMPDNFAVSSHTLSVAQADSITNYSDLRLQFTATLDGIILATNGEISWAELQVPTRQGVYDCSAVTLSSGRWVIDRIMGDLQDPKILNTGEEGKICIKLANNVYPNSYVTVQVTTDVGKNDSDRFRA